MGIYVWGTGCGASELIRAGLEPSRIAAFLDNAPSGPSFQDRPVIRPEQLKAEDAELLIVTARAAEEIAGQCAILGIPEERVLFLKNSARIQDRNQACARAEALLGKKLLNKLLPRQCLVTEPACLSSRILKEDEDDPVRLWTLELLCRRLEEVPGAAGELGVYRGRFARCINRLLPQRKLHLFDSFSGFSPEECPEGAFQEAHRNTGIEQVKRALSHPEQVCFHPGFFPESVGDFEERFCLVSLDVDFGASTLAGLRWFWPRLNPGGYLLLHDWANPQLPQVAQAFAKFQKEMGQILPGIPLPDLGGTLVLCKTQSSL